MTRRIFISSVQREFTAERKALGEYLRNDPLMRRFFDSFIFERDVPAADRRPDEVYLTEVASCDIYLALLGNQYGWENEDGLSPTHLEFDEATRRNKCRLIFVKGADDTDKAPKMQALIRQVGNQLVRRRFTCAEELVASVYASLVSYLETEKLIRSGPWDAANAGKASWEDIDPERVERFVRQARAARGFPLPEGTPAAEVLNHLNLLDDHKISNAAVLLFARQSQRFVISSEVKCARFHGTEVAKPIPAYQVYKGTAFELVDQAVDFVMSRIDLRVGTRDAGPQAPVEYEIPRAVVAEAIVNAVAHRDYTSNGSVQVMLFTDRLEVWNPGDLPASLTLDKLRGPHGSVPANPLLAEPLYLTKYIERMGTGTRDMIQICRDAGLPEPEFALTDGFVVTIRRPGRARPTQSGTQSPTQSRTQSARTRDQVDPKAGLSRDQVLIMTQLTEDKSLVELLDIVGRSNRTKFRDQVLNMLLENGLVEKTIPDKPRSSNQKYRLTAKGRKMLESIQPESPDKP